MRTSKVTYPIPWSPNNLTQLNPSAARQDQYQYLGNCPPTSPLRRVRGGVGGQLPRYWYWSARYPNHLPLVFFWCLNRLIIKIIAKAATETTITTITSQFWDCWNTPWSDSWYGALTSFSFVGGGKSTSICPLSLVTINVALLISVPVKKLSKGTDKNRWYIRDILNIPFRITQTHGRGSNLSVKRHCQRKKARRSS